MKKTTATLIFGAMMIYNTNATDDDTIVFIKQATDSRGQPNMVLEKIQADGGSRSVIFNSDSRETQETRGYDTHPIPYPKYQRSPSISPLGKKIALRRSWTISAMNWDGSDAVNLTPYQREWYDPCWSADGRKIALCTDIRNLAEIYVMNYNGSDLRDLTWKAKSNDRSPTWSPDSSKIAFISDRNGKFELFTMNAKDGTAQTRILSLDGDIREPAWGPNNRIAFALQKADGNSALYTVDPDGKHLKQLTNGSVWDGQVAWDSHGKRLAFSSNRNNIADIWVLDIASGRMHNVTNTPENNELFPTWVPKQLASQPLKIAATNGAASNITGEKLPRPRLLFHANDLPAIQKRFAKEPYTQVWKAFLANCDSLLTPDSKPAQRVENAIKIIKDNPPRGLYDRSAWIKPVFDLAFAYQVTGDKRYGKRAVAWLVRIAEQYAIWHQHMVFEYPVACAYDWLYDLFTPDELKRVTHILQTSAGNAFKQINDRYFGNTKDIEGNFATHSAGSFGPIALALCGEKKSNGAWLPAAARLTAINLNAWIGDAGDCSEGTSYFNAPVRLLMPFMVSLKLNNIYPETWNSNLKKFADWYAVVNAGGALPSIGDSDGGPVNFPLGLLQLYPKNQTALKLWNSVKRADKPNADVLSLLWFKPSENRPQDFSKYPKTAYFDAQNYQVFRSGYSSDSVFLTFTLTAGGHAHLECGAIALRAYRQHLLIDPGQAVHAADCHSQLLINGEGRFLNYKAANAPRERISPIQSNDLGAAASVNIVPAFATRQVGTHGMPPYSIPGPGVKLDHGTRTLVMVGEDESPVPPYYLIYDNVRVNDHENLYEQIYIGQADERVQANGNGSFVYRRRYTGPWLAPVSKEQGDAAIDFDIKQAGKYQVWVYMKQNPDSLRTGYFPFKIGDKLYHSHVAFRGSRAGCWQWAAGVFSENGKADLAAMYQRISGKPVLSAINLAKGKQTLEILPGNTIFAKIALIPEEESKTFQGWGELPKGAVVRSCSNAKTSGTAWKTQKPDGPDAELLVASLNTDPVTFKAESFSFNTRFYGQQFITLPRAKLVKRQKNANFLTLLYPYQPKMEQPRIHKEKDGATITWKNAVDTVRTTQNKLIVTRKHKNGKKEAFHYK